MHVVVVGCGRVGSGLARTLEESGHTVAVVDRRSKAFERLPDDFAGKTVLGVGFDRDRLKAAGIEEASALAAVTNGDNSNILVARVARETFGIENVIARIYDPRRAKIYERLGVPTIATVEWATERVLQRILPERPSAEWIDASAKVLLIERPVPAVWAGKKTEQLDVLGDADRRLRAGDRLQLGGDVTGLGLDRGHAGPHVEHGRCPVAGLGLGRGFGAGGGRRAGPQGDAEEAERGPGDGTMAGSHAGRAPGGGVQRQRSGDAYTGGPRGSRQGTACRVACSCNERVVARA